MGRRRRRGSRASHAGSEASSSDSSAAAAAASVVTAHTDSPIANGLLPAPVFWPGEVRGACHLHHLYEAYSEAF